MIRSAANALATAIAPRRIGVYNGVAVRDRAPLDHRDVHGSHKRALCNAVVGTVDEGDSVVVVGGGRGVAAVHAARRAADVTVYEGAAEMVDTLEETARLNRVETRMDIRHGIVGEAIDLYGNGEDAEYVSPNVLCGDVLVLDCEGAEQEILPTERFDRIVVETHPEFGAPTERIRDAIDGEVVAPDPHDGHVVVA